MLTIVWRQIWFQNRRQVTRRGSKPLLPHELYSSFHSSQESPGEHTASSFASSTGNQPDSSGSEITITRSSGNLSSQSDPVVTISAAQSRPSSTPPLSGSDEHSFSGDPDNEANMLHSQRNLESECEAWPAERMEVCVETMMAQKTISSHPAGLNHGIQTTIPNGSATAASSAPLRPLRGTPSSIRLSMSLDGKAQVVLGSGTTPSPPRQTTMPITSAGRPVSLQRSKSAMALSIHAQGNVGDTIPSWPRRSAPGRSGDVRTWEFYCDSDARNALTVQAEQEQKGSAIGILSLIRSGSSSSNIPSTGIITHNPQLKRVSMKRKNPVEINAPRPKVARTASSVATLQTTDATAQAFGSKTKMVDPKYDSQHAIYQDPSGDSDKENWEPGTQSRNFERQAIRHRPEFETQRAILQENTRMPSHSMSLGNLLNRDNIHPRRRENMMVNKLDSQQDKENIAVDGEVAKFMGQGSLPQPEDELNCVQNLLSLSQGAWR